MTENTKSYAGRLVVTNRNGTQLEVHNVYVDSADKEFTFDQQVINIRKDMIEKSKEKYQGDCYIFFEKKN